MGEIRLGLTNPQKSIWLTERMYPDMPIENICGSVFFEEKVDFTALEKAINLFVEKNDSFRIKLLNAEGEVQQYISDFVPFKIEKLNLKDEDAVGNLERELVSKVFPITGNLLFEFKMFELSNGNGGFTINAHHIISDAWTAGLVVNEIVDFYAEFINKKDKEEVEFPSYIDYINSEREYLASDRFKKDKEYWENIYTENLEVAKIPSVKERVIKKVDCSSNRVQYNIPKEIIDEINKLCAEKKVSIFNFFMAIFAIYLGKVSNMQEFVIGTPILNRATYKDKHTTGMFISTVPFKISLGEEYSFNRFITDIAKDSLSMLRHQKYPYQYLLESLRKKDNSIPNLYDILISYQNVRSEKPPFI